MIANPQHALDLGDFPLIGGEGESGWKVNVHASDASFGESQPVLVGVRSLLRDGMSVRVQSHENRDAYFLVEISGPDLAAVGDGEAALMAQLYRRNTLTWTPPDGYGAVTVFEVVTSKMSAPLDDMNELMLKRVFGITLTCLPFSRSATPTVIGSEFVSDSITIADDCESTTGWSQTGASGPGMSPTFAVDTTAGNFLTGTGSIKITPTPGPIGGVPGNSQYHPAAFRKALSIDASGGGYLTFVLRGSWNVELGPACYMTTSGGGKEMVSAISSVAAGSGFTRYAMPVTNNSTITELELTVNQFWSGAASVVPDLWMDSIGLSASSTSAQQARTLDIGGSARTEGSLSVSAVAGLGDVVLYTAPDLGDGFRPDMRRFLAVGTASTDTYAVNGTYVPLVGGPPVRFDAPIGQFRPGAYAVLAHVRGSGGANPVVSVNTTAQVAIGGTVVGELDVAESGAHTLVDSVNYEVIRVGMLHLPPTLVQASLSDAVVQFSVTTDHGGVRLDDLMVFPMEDAALTWVKCGVGSPSTTVSSRLWVNGPTLENPRGQVLVGNDASGSDAYVARPVARGSHMLYPGKMFVYLLTAAAGGAELAGTYYKAWHTHAGS